MMERETQVRAFTEGSHPGSAYAQFSAFFPVHCPALPALADRVRNFVAGL